MRDYNKIAGCLLGGEGGVKVKKNEKIVNVVAPLVLGAGMFLNHRHEKKEAASRTMGIRYSIARRNSNCN